MIKHRSRIRMQPIAAAALALALGLGSGYRDARSSPDGACRACGIVRVALDLPSSEPGTGADEIRHRLKA